MRGKICYLGDDHLDGAAAYLAGIMRHFGLVFDHVPSARSPGGVFASEQYGLYVVSDYPAERFQPGQLEHVVNCVRRGSGLVMIGGWESFHGRLGEYHDSPLAEALPVAMLSEDDRRNFAQPCVIRKIADDPILNGLPWELPPAIGGLNRVEPKPEGRVLLEALPLELRLSDTGVSVKEGGALPLLVVGSFGEGRTAALATDVAPHWVGGFVDWGDARVTQEVGSGFIEVGNWYAQFFRNLLCWAMKIL